MKKEKGFISGLKRKIKTLSIISTLAIHLSYIAYLSYSIKNDVGVKAVNIALIIGTGIFLLAYLVMANIGSGSSVKTTKVFYKRFKLITKLFSSGTAIYSLITASKAVSPFAMILPSIGASLLAIRITIELLVFLITRKTKSIVNGFKNKQERKRNQKDIDMIELSEEAYLISDEDLK